jgi:hypothetical protein
MIPRFGRGWVLEQAEDWQVFAEVRRRKDAF